MTDGPESSLFESEIDKEEPPLGSNEDPKMKLEALREEYKRKLIRNEGTLKHDGGEFEEKFNEVDSMSADEIKEALNNAKNPENSAS